MLEILTGLISGIVSGTGMGGGTILILILSVFVRNRSACSTGHKFSIFYPYIYNSNNSVHKRKIDRMENCITNYNRRNNWSYNWCKNFNKNECKFIKKIFWHISWVYCNLRNLFFNK